MSGVTGVSYSDGVCMSDYVLSLGTEGRRVFILVYVLSLSTFALTRDVN